MHPDVQQFRDLRNLVVRMEINDLAAIAAVRERRKVARELAARIAVGNASRKRAKSRPPRS